MEGGTVGCVHSVGIGHGISKHGVARSPLVMLVVASGARGSSQVGGAPFWPPLCRDGVSPPWGFWQ